MDVIEDTRPNAMPTSTEDGMVHGASKYSQLGTAATGNLLSGLRACCLELLVDNAMLAMFGVCCSGLNASSQRLQLTVAVSTKEGVNFNSRQHVLFFDLAPTVGHWFKAD